MSIADNWIELESLTRRAGVAAVSADDRARTVDLVFTTGAAVERMDWYSGKRYLEVLSLAPKHVRLDRLNSGASLLNSHSHERLNDVIGSVVPGSARIVASEGTATVQFSRRPDVEPIWRDVRDGIIRFVSVGYRVHKFVEEGGREGVLPTRTAVDWEPYELSMVAIPADAGAHVRGHAGALNRCVIVRADRATADADRNRRFRFAIARAR